MVDYIEHPVAEIDKTADDYQFEGMLTYLMVQNFLLVCPIEDEAGSLLEMQFLIVYAVELEEKVYQMPWIQEFLVSMKGGIGSYYP